MTGVVYNGPRKTTWFLKMEIPRPNPRSTDSESPGGGGGRKEEVSQKNIIFKQIGKTESKNAY